MVRAFLRRRTTDFRAWWNRPPTMRDRILGVCVGGLAGFWVGLLGQLFLGSMPAPFSAPAAVAMIGTVCGAALGIAFPKAVLILGFPFASLGVSS